MINAFFSFEREPFTRNLPADKLFFSNGHQELIARLRHAMESSYLAIFTGHVGSGKSTAFRSAMYSLDASRYRFIYLASSGLSPKEFYKSVLYQVSVTPARGMAENKRLFAQAMLERGQKGIKTVLVIDEAHELAVPMISELRFALNHQADSYSPLGIVLLGQPYLREVLQLQVLECIRQRITVCYQVPSLVLDEVGPYILHHLKLAGLDRQIFTDETTQLVAQFSKGVPRRINNICRNSLIAAMEAGSPVVDEKAVQKALEDTLL